VRPHFVHLSDSRTMFSITKPPVQRIRVSIVEQKRNGS
jgi:hypothetical protein